MRYTLPHPLVLLLGAVAVAVAMTWVVPAGSFERRTDPETHRQVVVAGTYARVPAAPVGFMPALMAVPRGIVAGADVVLVVLLVGGAFGLLDSTGALGRLVGSLTRSALRPRMVVVLVSLAFASLGALENMQEEIIALVPVLFVLSRGLGFGAVTALAMSVGAAGVGSAFGPSNPFQASIAQRFAEIPGVPHPGVRLGMLVAAVGIWIGWTLAMTGRDDVRHEAKRVEGRATMRDGVLLLIVLLPFVPYVIGAVVADWGFNELSGLYLVVGFAVGLVSGRGLSETATAFLKAMEGMLAAGLFVGVARGISVVLTDGRIIDTILFALASPLAHMNGMVAALLMVPMHALLHVPVPSVSGQAVLTMPIMAPLCDLLGLSREVAVVTYQTGAGLTDVIVPTNGAVLAMLVAARVGYGRWLRFAVPGVLLVSLVGLAGIVLLR